ncbi:MAG: hypothetical protein ACYC3I_03905 [Gemmataceae bacterium]
MDQSERYYRISFAGYSRQQLNALRDQAIRLDIQDEFSKTMKWIDRQLSEAPLEWGDPMYHLRYLQLAMYRGTRTPVNVAYAVDEQRKLVYLTQIWPMPGHGYTQET